MRKKIEPSYPLHKIETGLYTEGDEFEIFEDQVDYIGLYHILPNGDAWTEDVPTSSSKFISKKLFQASSSVKQYKRMNNSIYNNYIQPMYHRPELGDNDYQLGYIYRYFVQKRNNPINTIIEIDLEQYNSLNSRNLIGINSTIWNSLALKWRIKGTHSKDLNIKETLNSSKKFKGMEKYIVDYLEFYR